MLERLREIEKKASFPLSAEAAAALIEKINREMEKLMLKVEKKF